MSKFQNSSIGRKLFMSLTGLFLIVFIMVHLTVNLFLLAPFFGGDSSGAAYNIAAHFMATNPIIRIMEPILGIGFILHIAYAFIITYKNTKARPVAYAVVDNSKSSKWASQNMFVLGGLVFAFLAIHIANFYWQIKFGTGVIKEVNVEGVLIHDTYLLVVDKLSNPLFAGLYVLGGVFLGLHLSHGFWSAFQTIGFSNVAWRKRLTTLGDIFSALIAFGFAIIPVALCIAKMVSAK
jgi:succinate dehydrogenase / fumarate reductase cytochrome b subunit